MAFLNGGVPCPPPAMVCSAPFCHEALMSLGFLSLSLHVCKMGIILRRLACRGACRSTWNVAAAWNTLSAAVLTERQHLCDATVCPSSAPIFIKLSISIEGNRHVFRVRGTVEEGTFLQRGVRRA